MNRPILDEVFSAILLNNMTKFEELAAQRAHEAMHTASFADS